MRSDQAPVQYKTGGNVRSVAVADFNGDGKLDIAAYGPGQMESPLIANAESMRSLPYPASAPESST